MTHTAAHTRHTRPAGAQDSGQPIGDTHSPKPPRDATLITQQLIRPIARAADQSVARSPQYRTYHMAHQTKPRTSSHVTSAEDANGRTGREQATIAVCRPRQRRGGSSGLCEAPRPLRPARLHDDGRKLLLVRAQRVHRRGLRLGGQGRLVLGRGRGGCLAHAPQTLPPMGLAIRDVPRRRESPRLPGGRGTGGTLVGGSESHEHMLSRWPAAGNARRAASACLGTCGPHRHRPFYWRSRHIVHDPLIHEPVGLGRKAPLRR